MPELAGAGNGVEAPCALSAVDVVGVQEPADAVFASCHADQHFVLWKIRNGGDSAELPHSLVLFVSGHPAFWED